MVFFVQVSTYFSAVNGVFWHRPVDVQRLTVVVTDSETATTRWDPINCWLLQKTAISTCFIANRMKICEKTSASSDEPFLDVASELGYETDGLTVILEIVHMLQKPSNLWAWFWARKIYTNRFPKEWTKRSMYPQSSSYETADNLQKKTFPSEAPLCTAETSASGTRSDNETKGSKTVVLPMVYYPTPSFYQKSTMEFYLFF